MATVDKETYENIAALAEQIPEQWHGLYAQLLRTLITYPMARTGVKRWLKDAGYGTVHNYEVGS